MRAYFFFKDIDVLNGLSFPIDPAVIIRRGTVLLQSV